MNIHNKQTSISYLSWIMAEHAFLSILPDKQMIQNRIKIWKLFVDWYICHLKYVMKNNQDKKSKALNQQDYYLIYTLYDN